MISVSWRRKLSEGPVALNHQLSVTKFSSPAELDLCYFPRFHAYGSGKSRRFVVVKLQAAGCDPNSEIRHEEIALPKFSLDKDRRKHRASRSLKPNIQYSTLEG
jgi:hypothetical protein